MKNITELLQRVHQGNPQSADQLLELVYNELRNLAAHKMAHEPPGQTLQATALVHEAWLRLGGDQQPGWQNKAHFFAAAAEAMRRILIDRARRKKALRHGQMAEHIDIEAIDLPHPMDDEQLLALHDALDRLAVHEPIKADLVKMRFFVGLTLSQAAQALGISEPTAKRYWAYARAWLFREVVSRSTKV